MACQILQYHRELPVACRRHRRLPLSSFCVLPSTTSYRLSLSHLLSLLQQISTKITFPMLPAANGTQHAITDWFESTAKFLDNPRGQVGAVRLYGDG
jgi:hypothetical protein